MKHNLGFVVQFEKLDAEIFRSLHLACKIGVIGVKYIPDLY